MSGEIAWAAVVAVFFIGLFAVVPGCEARKREDILKCIKLTQRPVECRFSVAVGL